MVEQLSPGLSAFWGSVLMIFILLTQRPLLAYLRNQGQLNNQIKRGWYELLDLSLIHI